MGSLFFKSINLTFIKYKKTLNKFHILHSVEIINSPIVSYLKKERKESCKKKREEKRNFRQCS